MVPWAVLWSAEASSSWVDTCPYSGLQSIFRPLRRGIGNPLYAEFHPQRQRQAVAEDRCHVCGDKISGARISMGIEQDTDTVIDPLTCAACAALSLDVCPNLQAQRGAGGLVIREVIKSRWVPLTLERDPHVVDAFWTVLEDWRPRDEAWLRRQ